MQFKREKEFNKMIIEDVRGETLRMILGISQYSDLDNQNVFVLSEDETAVVFLAKSLYEDSFYLYSFFVYHGKVNLNLKIIEAGLFLQMCKMAGIGE